MSDDKEMGWEWENSYLTLPEIFFSTVDLNPVCSPQLVAFNETLAETLGVRTEKLKSDEGVAILAGNHQVARGAYIAQAYAGHQFGHFTMLGDGRALLIGEQITPTGERCDIQLKGSGQTPYSRRGDGRAALGPMLREYIISEAVYGLGIPTTRSLAVVQTGETVWRMEEEAGAILIRVAASHLRIGTFEYAYRFGGQEAVKALADYSINRHYLSIEGDANQYLHLLQEVIKTQANLIAKWQSVGFVHGVMNTDNMTISGETIDYGPCAFMDRYDPDTVFSSIDTEGRYRYSNQPHMAQWNLCRLAETLLPLLDESMDKAIEIAQEAVNNFPKAYEENWLTYMKAKLGIFNKESDDKKLIEELLSLMEKYQEDYTNTFIKLTFERNQDSEMFASTAFNEWYDQYQQRLQRQPQSKELVIECMKESNPAIIPRNHRVEEALEAATKGNYDVMNKLLNVLSRPYEHSSELVEYSQLPKASSCPYQTFCGT